MARMTPCLYAEGIDAREAGIHLGNRIDKHGFPLEWLLHKRDGNDKTKIYYMSLRFAHLQ
jgi:hypothetical protein